MNTAVVSQEPVSVEDYLAAEEQRDVRHEDLGGRSRDVRRLAATQ